MQEEDAMAAMHESSDEEEEGGAAKPSTTPLCQHCRLNPFKYKCPGCGFKSCGLACVKAHKELTSCTGKRNRTAFVPISQYDDNRLVSDYNLLEEILRETDSARRKRDALGCYSGVLGPKWQLLKNQARKRKIRLVYLPKGMSRRQENTSYYCLRRKSILWRIEWIFHSTEVQLVDVGVDEHVKPIDILVEKLTHAPGNAITCHKLRQFCKETISNIKLLVLREPHLGVPKQFIELDPTQQLRPQLENSTILEFLTLYVVLPSDVRKLKVVQILQPQPIVEFREFEGVPYKEEKILEVDEIEEGEIVD